MRHCKQKPHILSYQSFVTKESSLVNDEICGKKRISCKQTGAFFQFYNPSIVELAIKICFLTNIFFQYCFHCFLCSTIFVDLENSILRIHRFLGQCIYQHKLLLVIFFQRTFDVIQKMKKKKGDGVWKLKQYRDFLAQN